MPPPVTAHFAAREKRDKDIGNRGREREREVGSSARVTNLYIQKDKERGEERTNERVKRDTPERKIERNRIYERESEIM
jgi:hypothetical protein